MPENNKRSRKKAGTGIPTKSKSEEGGISLKRFLGDFAIVRPKTVEMEGFYSRGKFMLGLVSYVTIDRHVLPVITNRAY